MFSYYICEVFKKIYFEEHLRTTASGNTDIGYWCRLYQKSNHMDKLKKYSIIFC